MSRWKPNADAIVYTDTFKRNCKKNKVSKETLKHIKNSWILGDHNLLVEINSNKLMWSSGGGKIQIFSVKVPSKEKGRKAGKSGGYRLIITYILPEKKAVLETICKRSNLNSTNEKTKATALKKDLVKEYEKYIELNPDVFK